MKKDYLFAFICSILSFVFLLVIIYNDNKEEQYKIHTEIRIFKVGNIEVHRDTIDVITLNK